MLKSIVSLVAVLFSVSVAQAQSFPNRPITIVVPFPAGGSTGAMARILLEPMQAVLGQPIIIENVGGAGGSLGAGRVARAAPDGYTICFSHMQTHVLNGAVLSLSYDVVADFEPLALIADTPQIVVTRTAFPANDLKELIGWLKANPNKGTSGAVGIGGPSDISAFQFKQMTGTSFQSVPYRGGGPLLADLVSGQIDINFGQASTYIGAVRNGQLKALATQAKERWWGAPEVPTVDEAGVQGLYGSYWHGMWLPKGTPKDIVAKLNAAVMVALADPMVQQRFRGLRPEHLAARSTERQTRWRHFRRRRSSGGIQSSRRPASRRSNDRTRE